MIIINHMKNSIVYKLSVRRKGGKNMGNILAAIGSFFAGFGTQACIVWILDEPEMPRHLIER